jgi:SAM-dependent methyltransferase
MTVNGRSVLDVGSADLNGDARSWFTLRGYHYTGADIEPRKGVDVLIDKSCVWELADRYDLIVSLNTFEHVDKPWILVKTMAEHLKPFGTMLIVAPFSFQYHRHPVDCWRYTPDAMAALAHIAGLSLVTSYLSYEASATYGTVSDIVWLMRRRRIRDALRTIPQWRTRPPAWHCVAVMRKAEL